MESLWILLVFLAAPSDPVVQVDLAVPDRLVSLDRPVRRHDLNTTVYCFQVFHIKPGCPGLPGGPCA